MMCNHPVLRNGIRTNVSHVVPPLNGLIKSVSFVRSCPSSNTFEKETISGAVQVYCESDYPAEAENGEKVGYRWIRGAIKRLGSLWTPAVIGTDFLQILVDVSVRWVQEDKKVRCHSRQPNYCSILAAIHLLTAPDIVGLLSTSQIRITAICL